MRDVYVVGVAMTPFGRHLEQTHAELAQTAVRAAFQDAGVGPGDLDTAIYANVTQGVVAGELSIPGEFALRPLGIEGVQVMHVEAACASSTMGLHIAANYIRAGLSDVALVVGAEKLYSEDRDKRMAVFRQPLDAVEARRYLDRTAGLLAEAPEGAQVASGNSMMDAYAAQARLHMRTYGSTARQIAAIAAKNHVHSQHNPLSQYRKPMTVEEVVAAAAVSWPLTTPMCAPISDGASAAILVSAEAMKRFSSRRAVRLMAFASRSGRDRAPDDYARHVTRGVAAQVFEAAGVGPSDIDVAEVHDASSFGEMVQLEALGLCAPGEAGAAAERGELSIGGRIPVNPSGGLVSKGHPLAATGLGQIHELVTQLRGEAGPRQVEGARLALAENSGGFYGVEDGMSCVTLLEKT